MRIRRQSILVEVLKLAFLALLMVFVTINTTKQIWMEDRYTLLREITDARCDEGVTSLPAFCKFFNNLDIVYNVFAAVYDKDLNLLTDRNPDITPGRTVYFEPLQYSEIVLVVKAAKTGTITVNFDIQLDSGKVNTYSTPVYFRWVGDVLVMMATPYISDTIRIPNTYIIIFLVTVFLLFLSIAIPTIILFRSERKEGDVA